MSSRYMSEFRNAVWANTQATRAKGVSCTLKAKPVTTGLARVWYGSGHGTGVPFLILGTKVHFKLSAVMIYDPVTVVLSHGF